MAESATYTFLFTDIEGSTRRWQEDPEAMRALLASVRAAAWFPFRTPADILLYRQTLRSVCAALDLETAARCRAEGAAIPVSRALDEQLARQPAERTAR